MSSMNDNDDNKKFDHIFNDFFADDINDYMSGNACRCATYQRIRAGVQRAAEILEA